MMSDLLQRNELINDAERHTRARDYRAVISLLQSLSPAELESNPILLYLLAHAHYHIGNDVVAWDYTLILAGLLDGRVNDRLFRLQNNLQGIILLERGKIEAAERQFALVAERAVEAGDQLYEATAFMNMGIIADIKCDWFSAIRSYNRALAPFWHLGEMASVAGCHHNLGMAFRQIGDLVSSDSHFALALEMFSAIGTQEEIVATEFERALLISQKGDRDLAKKSAIRALHKAEVLKNVRLQAESLRVLGVVLIQARELLEARRVLQAAFDLCLHSTSMMLKAEITEGLAYVSYLNGDADELDSWTEQTEECYRRMGASSRLANFRRRVMNAVDSGELSL